jgi:hypothetical protein
MPLDVMHTRLSKTHANKVMSCAPRLSLTKKEISRVCLLRAFLLNPPTFLSHDHLTMADKEATVYIIDVGKSMGERRHGRLITDLEWAMQYVWDKITTTVCGTSVFDKHL